MVRALVLDAVGSPLRLAELDLPDPGPGQVRVRLAATGVCHSDLSLARGVLRAKTPVVLGHESAGTVVAVGEGVQRTAVGDRVVLCWAPPCGECWYCAEGEPWLCERSSDAAAAPYATVDGVPVHPGLSTGGFAEETVVSRARRRAGARRRAARAGRAGRLRGHDRRRRGAQHRAGCGPGQSVLVVGLGGVGLSVLQGARLAGAGRGHRGGPVAGQARAGAHDGRHRRARGRAASCPGRCAGSPSGAGSTTPSTASGLAATIRASWAATRRGGTTTVVGIGPGDTQVSFSPLELFHFARVLQGCVYGSTDPQRDLPTGARARGGRRARPRRAHHPADRARRRGVGVRRPRGRQRRARRRASST